MSPVPSTAEVLARLEVLWRKLEDEGSYARANTVFLAIEEIKKIAYQAERFEKDSDYSIQLARIIEAICHGNALPEGAKDLHHYRMAAAFLSKATAQA